MSGFVCAVIGMCTIRCKEGATQTDLLNVLRRGMFVAAFFAIIIALVVRKGRTIRDHLKDEVLLGSLTQQELDLVTSPFGRLTCTFSWRGGAGRDGHRRLQPAIPAPRGRGKQR